MDDFWSVVSEKKIKELEKLHKFTNDSIKNRGSTLTLTNLVGVNLRKIPTKFKANLCSGLREEVENVFNEDC